MKQIRIHNDLEFAWTIDRGDGTPYNLAGRNLRLWMKMGNLEIAFPDFTIQDNVIRWQFLGKDQYKLGIYSVVLAENAGAQGEITIDELEVVELVSNTAYANGEQIENAEVTYVEITSRLQTDLFTIALREILEKEISERVGSHVEFIDSPAVDSVTDLKVDNTRRSLLKANALEPEDKRVNYYPQEEFLDDIDNFFPLQ